MDAAPDPAAGGNSEVRFRLFDSQGNPLNGSNSAGVLIDNVGGVNKDIQIAALQNIQRNPRVVLPKAAAEAELVFPQPGWNDKRRT